MTRTDDPAIAERKRERLRRVWGESVALDHRAAHAVWHYLHARGLGEILKAPPAVLRAHPGLPYWDHTRELGLFPAMLALFSDARGQPATVHATYLRGDGSTKAPVPNPRKLLPVPVPGSTKGGAIQLHSGRAGILGIGEGIETALSLHLLQRVPVWSAFSADNLERVRLPAGLRQLYIAVDRDESGRGEQAAQALATRVSKWPRAPKIFLCRPEGEGPRDLNDELLHRRAG